MHFLEEIRSLLRVSAQIPSHPTRTAKSLDFEHRDFLDPKNMNFGPTLGYGTLKMLFGPQKHTKNFVTNFA